MRIVAAARPTEPGAEIASLPAILTPDHPSASDRGGHGLLTRQLPPRRYTLAQAYLPSKLLAVRSGLANCGRHSIAYIEGMGCFFRLAVFYTDAPLPETEWREPRLAPACEHCSACTMHCPNGATLPDRFLPCAERCPTFHNERVESFPGWIDPAWHHCLIGCMHCQMPCPLNSPVARCTEDAGAFSAEKTARLPKADGAGGLAPKAKEKLHRVGLTTGSEILSRNLKLLIDRS